MLRCGICWRCLGLNAKMYDLFPVSWARSGVRMLRCTICCRGLGLEAGFVAGVLGSKRGPNAKMYVLLQCLGLEAGSEC